MRRVLTSLAAAALLGAAGCDRSDKEAVKKPSGEQAPMALGYAPQTQQAPLPPAAQALRDAVADRPVEPATVKPALDRVFDNNRATGGVTQPNDGVAAPAPEAMQAKARVVLASLGNTANTPLHRSGARDQPKGGTLPPVPLPDPRTASGDANVRGGGEALVAFDAYLRGVYNQADKVFSRAFWGASRSTAREGHQNPTRVTIHHTDGRQTMTVEESRRAVKNIQDFHQGPDRGWGDIGYHFLVDGAGNVFEGRHADVIGAHVWQHNLNNIGIANLGDYNHDQLTDAQKETLTRLITFLAMKYSTDPGQSGFIEGHHHFSNNDTDCPGKNIDRWLPDLRQAVQQNAARVLARANRTFVPLVVSGA